MDSTYDIAAQRIVFTDEALDRLAQITADLGLRRLLLCTSPHWQRSGFVDQARDKLGETLVAVYDQTLAHVPEQQAAAALTLAEQQQADGLIALGGGSVIGLAKAVSHRLAQMQGGAVPIIALPSTYAGSEMTPIYGVTHDQPDGSRRKVTTRDDDVTPQVVIYDAQLTLDLPPQMSAASGVNALAHGIEAVYSLKRNPLSTAVALRAITIITAALPAVVDNGQDLAARRAMLEGAHLAGMALATVTMGIHHGTGHVLGGTAGVPHGIANAIVLPYALRFNADTVPHEIAIIGEAMGVSRSGRSDEALALATADALQQFIGALGLPQRLRDAGVAREQLPQLAQNLLLSKAVQTNPKALETQPQALVYLEAMW